MGTAGALENGGPVGLLLGYTIVGTICYCVMISLGEMVAYLPIPGGHIKLAERFVDPALSFAMGWNYWYNWVIVLPAELSAASVLIDFWDQVGEISCFLTDFINLYFILNSCILLRNTFLKPSFAFIGYKAQFSVDCDHFRCHCRD